MILVAFRQKSLNLPGDNSVYRTVCWMLREMTKFVWLIVVTRWFFNEVPDWAVISRHRHPAVAEEVVE